MNTILLLPSHIYIAERYSYWHKVVRLQRQNGQPADFRPEIAAKIYVWHTYVDRWVQDFLCTVIVQPLVILRIIQL